MSEFPKFILFFIRLLYTFILWTIFMRRILSLRIRLQVILISVKLASFFNAFLINTNLIILPLLFFLTLVFLFPIIYLLHLFLESLIRILPLLPRVAWIDEILLLVHLINISGLLKNSFVGIFWIFIYGLRIRVGSLRVVGEFSIET